MDSIKKRFNAILSSCIVITLAVATGIGIPGKVNAETQYIFECPALKPVINLPSGDSITMLETILRISTSHANENIEHITLVKLDNGFAKVLNTCKSQICEYNVQRLPRGFYKVIVKTNFKVFSDTITIK